MESAKQKLEYMCAMYIQSARTKIWKMLTNHIHPKEYCISENMTGLSLAIDSKQTTKW